MNAHPNSELRSLLSDSLLERQGSYVIEDLLHHSPTVSELTDATEQELVQVKGIGLGKARQLVAMLKLAKVIINPVNDRSVIRSPKDVFELLEPDFRHLQKEHFVCLFLNTKNRPVQAQSGFSVPSLLVRCVLLRRQLASWAVLALRAAVFIVLGLRIMHFGNELFGSAAICGIYRSSKC
ncbi:JAB domain-containing protein [Paenibacillus cremeus]|uniref:RadC-like JAB domain-containing protein n=1 Tax=Paenibacillus cremeus TaxID=2163881 RepID=A0A559K8D6_9BACL|nr:hypothetical protein FPZ49_19330 [Paenibacillus cremeus]